MGCDSNSRLGEQIIMHNEELETYKAESDMRLSSPSHTDLRVVIHEYSTYIASPDELFSTTGVTCFLLISVSESNIIQYSVKIKNSKRFTYDYLIS